MEQTFSLRSVQERYSCEKLSFFFFCLNPLLFASYTNTFSKWCKIVSKVFIALFSSDMYFFRQQIELLAEAGDRRNIHRWNPLPGNG
jgi:hypothetical protein